VPSAVTTTLKCDRVRDHLLPNGTLTQERMNSAT
jgi:hypothetical protein